MCARPAGKRLDYTITNGGCWLVTMTPEHVSTNGIYIATGEFDKIGRQRQKKRRRIFRQKQGKKEQL